MPIYVYHCETDGCEYNGIPCDVLQKMDAGAPPCAGCAQPMKRTWGSEVPQNVPVRGGTGAAKFKDARAR